MRKLLNPAGGSAEDLDMPDQVPSPGGSIDAAPGALVPVPRYDKPDTSVRGGVPVGVLLERARRRVGYTPEAVCRALWLSEIDLDHFESGIRTPPANVVIALAEFYGIDPARFDPDAGAELHRSRGGADRDLLWLGWASVDLTDTDGSSEYVVRGIAQTLRSMRSLGESATITIRDEELVTIGSALDLDDEELPAALARWFVLEPAAVAELVARLHHAVMVTKQLPAAPD